MTAAVFSLRRLLTRLAGSTRAIGAVEFALTAPFLILLYVGSFQLMDAISAYRKVTVTARTLTDLATQKETITPDEVETILDGARQVMTPYSTVGSTLVIAEIAIDANGAPSLTWVCSNQDSPKCSSSSSTLTISDVDVPNQIAVPNTHVVFSQIVFHYTPAVAGSLIGPITFGDHIFMNPRRSPSICLNTGTPTIPVCVGEGGS